MRLTEGYDTGAHQWQYPAMAPATSTPDFWPDSTSDYRYNNPTLKTVGTLYGNQMSQFVAVSSGSNTYFIVANADGVFFCVEESSGPNSLYAGTGTTLVAPSSDDPVPLFLAYNPNESGAAMGSTRDPGFVTLNANYQPWTYAVNPWSGIFIPSQNAAPTIGNTSTYDRYQNGGRPVACRYLIYKPTQSAFWSNSGLLRALLPAWILYMQSTGIAVGDTSVIGGSDSFFYTGGNTWVDSAA
jgi:hypothetical protein